RRGVAFVSILALTFAACGTRMTHNQIVQDAQGRPVAAGQSAAAGQQGAVAGEVSGTGAGGSAGSTTGAAGGGTTGGATASGGGGSGSAAGTTGSGGGGSGGGTTAAKGAPIVIGSVGNYSGPTGASEGDGPKALQLWARHINDT